MQNEQRHELKARCQSINQFDDSEYERWSERFNATQSFNAESGFESFLGTNENMNARNEDMFESSIEMVDK